VSVEAVRVLLEAMRVVIEAVRKFIGAVRKIIETVRKIIEAVRLFVKVVRVLRSSANKSIPIDPRLRNNCLRSRFDPLKFRVIVRFCFDLAKCWTNLIRFASIILRVRLTTSFFLRSCIVLD
jgi:hypothetical protein